MKKNGRPLIEIDSYEFKKLCKMQCTLVEIAGFFDCSEDTIERWCVRTFEEGFAECYKKFSADGKVSLRRKQFQIAEEGSVPMLIFLGKQYLGQSDKVSHDGGPSAIKLSYMIDDSKTE